MLLGCVTISYFKALTADGVERAYAIELIGDAAWKVYANWARLPRLLARAQSRDPAVQMRQSVNAFLRFPFTPPGYRFDRFDTPQGVSLDMLRCPIASFFSQQGAADLCVGTWCNLDFALAETWGGQLERTTTLAAGDGRCDFRFSAKAAD
jgi:hypothetical protein